VRSRVNAAQPGSQEARGEAGRSNGGCLGWDEVDGAVGEESGPREAAREGKGVKWGPNGGAVPGM
jgi:hypothetical protein